MSDPSEFSGLEPRINEPHRNRRTVVVGDEGEGLTGFEPQLGGIRRIKTNPEIITRILMADSPGVIEDAAQQIAPPERRFYAIELVAYASPVARRRAMLGRWQVRYTKKQRLNALEAVGMLRYAGPEVIRALFTVLSSKDALIQRAVMVTLSNLWNIEQLYYLTHETAYWRQMAANELGDMRDPRTIGPLLVSLGDEDPSVRAAVVQALGHLCAEPASAGILGLAVEDLLGMVADTDGVVRRSVQNAISEIAASMLPGDPRTPALAVPLSDKLRGGEPAERILAANGLGRLADARIALNVLVPALQDVDFRVRRAVVLALGQLGDARVFDALRGMLDDSDLEVRRSAVLGLGGLQDERVVPLLLDVFGGNPEVRFTVARVFAALGAVSVAAPLGDLLRESPDNMGLREAVAVALRNMYTPEARDLIEEFNLTEIDMHT